MSKMLIVGHYGWWGLQGDWRKHLLNLRKCGVTHIRIFGQFSWPEGRGTYVPFSLVKSIKRINDFPWNPPLPNEEPRKNRYFEQDGKVLFRHRKYPNVILPVYDLDFLDVAYFDKLLELCDYCEEIEMGIIYEMEDWCSLKHGGIEKYRHPYFVSPQAHSADTPGGLFGEPLHKYMCNYWNNALPIFYARGNNVMVSVMNEYTWSAPKQGLTPIEEKEAAISWYTKSMNIMSNALDEIHFVGSCMADKGVSARITNLCDYYAVHGVGDKKSYEAMVNKFIKDGLDFQKIPHKIILAGDGFSTGTGKPDFKGRRGITMAEVPFLCNKVNDGGYAGLEILIRYTKGHANGTYEEFDQIYGGYEIASECAKRLSIPGWLPPPPPPPEDPPYELEKPIEPPSPPSEGLSFFKKLLKGLKKLFKWLFGKNSLISKLFKNKA